MRKHLGIVLVFIMLCLTACGNKEESWAEEDYEYIPSVKLYTVDEIINKDADGTILLKGKIEINDDEVKLIGLDSNNIVKIDNINPCIDLTEFENGEVVTFAGSLDNDVADAYFIRRDRYYSYRVLDHRNNLTEDELEEIDDLLLVAAAETKLDIAILSIRDLEGKSTIEFGKDYYIKSNLGYGKEREGILFMIGDEACTIITCGDRTKKIFTDEDIEAMTDILVDDYINKGNYYGAYEKFISLVVKRVSSIF